MPPLERIELQLGHTIYDSDCWAQNLVTAFEVCWFLVPVRLLHLGLRNSNFVNEMMDRVVGVPLLRNLQPLAHSLKYPFQLVLDLSDYDRLGAG